MPIIVAIGGKKRAGKNYLASSLEREIKIKNKWVDIGICSFADPLKKIINLFTKSYNESDREVPKSDFDYLRGTKLFPASEPITERKLLQKIGTDLFREHISEDIWVRLMKKRLACSNKNLILIPDARFENEYTIADIIVYVHGPKKVKTESDLHISELYTPPNAIHIWRETWDIDRDNLVNIIVDYINRTTL